VVYSFEVTITDEQGEAIARVTKLLSVRLKDRKSARASG
jgi:hypothetical protein